MKKDNRTKRLVLGILLPLILGSVFFFTWGVVENIFFDGKVIIRFDHELPIFLGVLKSVAHYFGGILATTIYAAWICGVQSVLISLLMEYVINPKIENNLIVLFICGFLGLINGALFGIILGKISLIVVGGITGVVVGKILRDNYNRSSEIES